MKGRMLSAAAGVCAACILLAASAGAAEKATAQFKDKAGKEVGAAELVETPTGVLLTVKLKGIPAGEHGFHIHAVGKCEPPFTSAGGHFNPQQAKHGFLSEEGPHSGDMPNIFVPANGELTVQIWNLMVTLLPDTEDTLLDADGAALIIHAGPDDHKTDPAGNSGDRLACAIIQAQ